MSLCPAARVYTHSVEGHAQGHMSNCSILTVTNCRIACLSDSVVAWLLFLNHWRALLAYVRY